MVYEMLHNISDSREKTMAKLESQQNLIQLKYNIPAEFQIGQYLISLLLGPE